ncbi:MAG: tetratricopeptide repeat protein [Thiotrichales bacterium]
MTEFDSTGLTLSGADDTSATHYQRALHQFQCYIEDPVASVDAALNQCPEFTMAHALKAYLHLLGTEPEGIPIARDSLAAATACPANRRERAHLEAISHLIAGRWHQAGRVLEDITVEFPHDILALQAGHLTDFYTGNSRMLRDRIARVVRDWSPEIPGYHVVLGLYAFGLEETADYIRAEAYGRLCVEQEPRDGWGWHAVAHVMEMQNRARDGADWLRANPDAWSRDSFFQVHLWWHLALFHLGQDDIDAVLELFDGPIHGNRSPVILDLIDASALLWRLHLRGIDLGARWQTVADLWQPVATAGNYSFNDAHAAMAFIGAGRDAALVAVVERQHEALRAEDDNARFTHEVGQPLTLALRAFGAGRYTETIERIRPIREIAHRFGGSHAQRDLLDLTLIEAARRAGDHSLERALRAERHEARFRPLPFTPSRARRTFAVR